MSAGERVIKSFGIRGHGQGDIGGLLSYIPLVTVYGYIEKTKRPFS